MEHSYQTPYRDPELTRELSREVSRADNGYHDDRNVTSENSTPDIPPLFDTGISHLRASRKGVPPPFDAPLSPPVQFAPVNVVQPFPSQYGGQVNKKC